MHSSTRKDNLKPVGKHCCMMNLDVSCWPPNVTALSFISLISLSSAFYEEEVSQQSKKQESSSVKIEQKKAKSSSMSQQISEMHQHSQSMQTSTTYSAEVVEWQKMAKKEKVANTMREQKTLSVSCTFK